MAVATFEAPPADSLTARVGLNVRALMATHGVTQAALAQRLGLPQTAISKRLRGVVAWNVNEVGQVAEAFGVAPETLLLQGLPRLDSNQQPAGYGYSMTLPAAA